MRFGRSSSGRWWVIGAAFLWACAPDEVADGTDRERPEPGDGVEALAPSGLPNPFRMVGSWGEMPEGRQWGATTAVHIDRDRRHLWAAERCGANACVGSDAEVVVRVDPEGRVVESFGAGLFVWPHGIHVDDDGNLWVSDARSARDAELQRHPEWADRGDQVVKFSPEGEVLLVLGTPGAAGDPPARLTRPSDIITAPNGDVFVTEGHSNTEPPGRISRFAADGTFLESWGRFGSEPGQFRTPHALAFDSRGRLFVADRGNNRIQIFDLDGNFLEEWSQFGRPNGLFIDENDVLYAIDAESDAERNPGMRRGIYIGSARTGEVTGFVPADPEYAASGSEGITMDSGGNLYVGEVSARGLTKYVRR